MPWRRIGLLRVFWYDLTSGLSLRVAWYNLIFGYLHRQDAFVRCWQDGERCPSCGDDGRCQSV